MTHLLFTGAYKRVIILPILQMKKLRHRPVKYFVQRQTASAWQLQKSNPGNLALELLLFITVFELLFGLEVEVADI